MPEAPWWRSGVIYQIAVPSFADSNGDGWGDLRGLIERLDHLSEGTADSLGVDAIWLSPINASPMHDFGYDVTDYLAIDPRFGTMADFEELLAECHRRDMRVMMDLVLNHTSDRHPWFTESRSARENARRDWYVWRDGRGPGKPPNAWRAVVEGSAWEYDEPSGQYYYHTFLPFQPDLNWRNSEVREAMLGVARHWLDKGVDGFRLDLVNCLYEDAALRDNPSRFGVRPYLAQRHIHDLSQPESLEAAAGLRRLTDEYRDRVLVGEVFTDEREVCVAYLGDGTDRLHLSFYLDFVRQKWNAAGFRRSVDWLEAHLPDGAWPCYYLDNHDLPRSYTRLGAWGDRDARARVAAAMLLTLRGTPILYYGQEIGMPDSTVPRRRMRDPIGTRFWPLGVGRDGSRTPMQWTGQDGAGFTVGEAWLPVDSSYARRNVEAENLDPSSLLSWYRSLLALRKARRSLQSGSYRPLDAPRGVYAYLRELDGETTAVLLNFVRHGRTVDLSGVRPGSAWRALLTTNPSASTARGACVTLRPNEALILDACEDARR